MEKFLKNLYKKFLVFNENIFVLNAQKFSTSLKNLGVPEKTIRMFYRNYSQPQFLTFLYNIKTIIYSQNVFEFIVKNFSEDWGLWPYLKFLEKEKIIKVKRNGEVIILKKELLKVIPAPREEKEIQLSIEKKLKTKIQKREPVVNLFKKFQDFEVRAQWDQMPISQESAIFAVKKILDYLPLNKKFLLVGDDDFISVILTLAEPNIECKAVDADENLLKCIDNLSSKFNLKIETEKIDIRKRKNLNEKFIGFLTNPVYTEQGVKEFVKFGKNQLGKDGGFVFLEVGDEAIGSRFLFLQKFFNQNNLIIREIIADKIYYPYVELYKEDKEIFRRMSLMIDKKVIEKSPKLGASFYVFEYLSQRPKRIKFKKPFYAYL